MNHNKYFSDFTRNNLSSLFSHVPHITNPQKNTIKDVVCGLFKKGTPILRELSNSERNVSAKKQSERIGRNLEKGELTTSVNKFILRRSSSFIQEDTVIAYDLSDINKENSKKMEGISRVFDGSKRGVANGYSLHGVGTADFLLRLDLHEGEKEFLPQRRKTILEEITEKIGTKGIWAFDRGNDDKKLFSFLDENNLRFIVRLKENRTVIFTDTEEEKKIREIGNGKYEVYVRNENGKVNKKHKYLLIIHSHIESENHTPIRLLCSTKLQDKSNEKLVEIYLQRWGVENSFRRIKNSYQIEKIRLMKWNRLKNLIALILFIDFLASLFFIKMKNLQTALLHHIFLLYKSFLKKSSKTFNPYAFRHFLRKIFPKNLKFSLGAKISKSKSQPTLWESHHDFLGII